MGPASVDYGVHSAVALIICEMSHVTEQGNERKQRNLAFNYCMLYVLEHMIDV